MMVECGSAEAPRIADVHVEGWQVGDWRAGSANHLDTIVRAITFYEAAGWLRDLRYRRAIR
jgi:plasmid replication initiation protein